MMPMVFCASLPPCPRLYSDADTSCSRRNQRSTLCGAVRKKIHATTVMSRIPSAKPRAGESDDREADLEKAAADQRADARPSPPRRRPAPPISACDDDDGRPNHQVMTFQAIAPISVPNST